MSAHVVIVGGGISGLATAYRLERLAPDVAITLVEREGRLGGKLLTERVGGLVIEGGPDCFLSRKPRGIALCEELGISGRLQARRSENKRTFVLRDGTLHDLPEGLTGMVPTDLSALEENGLISAEGRARLAQEAELPANAPSGDESVASFVTRRLGQEPFDWLVEPLMGGIYAGDAAQLSIEATFPQLRRLEAAHGSVIRGLLAGQARPVEPSPYPPFVSLQGGMEKLVEAIVARLERTERRLGQGVASIHRTDGGYLLQLETGERLHADALVLATPAFVTAALIEPWDAPLAAAHRDIPYASVATLSLAYNEADLPAPLAGYGYVIPRAEGKEVLACTWSSSKWAGRAPAGQALIRVYLGRFGARELLAEPDEVLVRMARDELATTLGITVPPTSVHLYRWPQAMPQYNLGHLERLAQIEARLPAHPGLFLASAAYRGVGIPDCIQGGEQAARGAATYLKTLVTSDAKGVNHGG